MGRGRTCGTLTGALMVLGMAGGTNSDVQELWQRFGDAHVSTDCRDLLAASTAAGIIMSVDFKYPSASMN